MGIKEFYFAIEDKYYKLIDKLDTIFPAHAIVDKIDKIMPSMVLFFILFLVIIALIVWAVMPSYVNVKISFFAEGLQVTQDIPFSVFIDDKNISFTAKSGVAQIKLPKSDLYRIKVDTDRYSVDEKYSFAEEIKVTLEVKKKILPVEIYFKDAYGKDIHSVSAFLSCEAGNLSSSESSKTAETGYITVQVPEDCGDLTVTANAEGYSQKSEICDSTTCVVYLSPVTKASTTGTTKIPVGTLTVNIKDEAGNSTPGSVQIYNTNDLISPADAGYAANGYYKSSALPVGTYNVYCEAEGYLPDTQTVTINEAGSIIDVILKKSSLGNITLKLDENIDFSVKLKSLENEILFSGESQNQAVILPVFGYEKYLLDITPKDGNYAVIANREIKIEQGQKEIIIDVKKITAFNSKKFKIRVIDEDELPVQGAKVFVQDVFTGFELFSYVIPETDANGKTEVIISEQGVYLFRVYKGYSEGISDQVQVVETNAGEMPEQNVEVIIYLGTGGFNLQVLDELDYPVPFAQFEFYNKGFTKSIGKKLSDNLGKISFSLKAGTEKFFVVEKEGYLPFFSESRILTPQVMWDGNIRLEPQKLKGGDEKVRVDFLGIFDSVGGKKTTFEIGKEVYLGYDIHLYEEAEEMVFEYITGKDSTKVEQDNMFIVDNYSSSQSDSMFEDIEKKIYTEDKGKVLTAKWTKGIKSQKVETGVYRIYVKLKVRNDTSVSLYAPLNIKWRVYLNGKIESSEEKQYFLSSSVDCTDMFCAKTAVMDLENELYLENLGNVNKNEQKYALVVGKAYKAEFTLMNGITASDGEIENGYLKAHVANDPNQSFIEVEADKDSYNYFQFQKIKVSGPNLEAESIDFAKTVLIDDYTFKKFFANKTINGEFAFLPIYDKPSYLNFWVIDSDKKVPVRGKPAFNFTFVPDALHSLSIKLFPNTVLVPNKVQSLKVYVYDETEAIVKDAKVVVMKKGPEDTGYSVVSSCFNLVTDYEGKVVCELPPFEPGTYIQVTAYKKGYKSYKHKDLAPDLKVVDKILTFSPEKLDITISYPKNEVVTADLIIINASAQDVILKKGELIFDKYSQNSKYLLDWEAMESYFASEFNGKVIYGIEEKLEPNETTLKNFFKVIAGQNIDNTVYADKIGGVVKLYIDTNPGEIVLEIPFSISFKLDSYPENAEDCLRIDMDEKDFYLEKGLSTPLKIINTCMLDIENHNPAVFNKVFALLTLEDGSYSVAGYTLTIPDKMSTSVDVGIPTLILENLKADLAYPRIDGVLGISPRTTKGTQKIGIKLIAYVNTEAGSAKIESNKIEINVNSVNIANCIKIYDKDGEEIEKIDFDVFDSVAYLSSQQMSSPGEIHGPPVEIEIKNECPGSVLYLRACRDNDNNFSVGCGTETTSAKLSFSVDDLTKIEGLELQGNESKRVKIYRPGIPGAYALDLWVRTKDQFGFRKIYELKTNVKITTSFGLFSFDPFLQTMSEPQIPALKDKNQSEILYLFNKDIFKENLMDALVLDKIEHCGDDNIICWDFLNLRQKVDERASSWTLAATFVSTGLATGGGIGYAIYVIAEMQGSPMWPVVIAALVTAAISTCTIAAIVGEENFATARRYTFWTGTGLGSAGTVATIALLVAGSNAWNPVGWIALGVAVGGTITAITAAAITDFYQLTEYYILNYRKQAGLIDDPVLYDLDSRVLLDSSGHEIKDQNILHYGLTGEKYFKVFKVKKEVGGSVGFSDGDHKEDLWFEVDCGPDYLPYVDGIKIVDKKRLYCSWPEHPYDIQGSNVKFKPDCSAAGFLDEFILDSNIYVPCIMKDKPWMAQQFMGVDIGYPQTGLARLSFFVNKVNPGYNFYDLNLPVQSVVSGDVNYLRYRIAIYNPLLQDTPVIPLGQPCTSMDGSTILGFTGPDAVPKVNYNWSWDDENGPYKKVDFCGSENYCDATQFTMNIFKRIEEFTNGLKDITEKHPMVELKSPALPEGLEADFSVNLGALVAAGLRPFNSKSVDHRDGKVILKIAKLHKDINIESISVAYNTETFDLEVTQNNPNMWIWTMEENVTDLASLDNKDYNIALRVIPKGQQAQTILVDIRLHYIPAQPPQSMGVPISTQYEAGSMMLNRWFLQNDPPIYNEIDGNISKLKNYIFFTADLMKDGFTPDFFEDFIAACDEEFFFCPDNIRKTFISKLENGTFLILVANNENKMDTPGTYIVNTFIDYANPDLEIKDANIVVILTKLKAPIQDSILYYLPLDGAVGITNYEVHRQGYGVDFSGATIELFSMGALDKRITTNSVSNPINSVNISSDYSFVKANKFERGQVLGIKAVSNNQVSVDFLPLNRTKYTTKISPESNKDTKFCYSVVLNDKEITGPDSVLPFYAQDANKKDLTGQLLADTYPRLSEPNICGDRAGIKYPFESVTSKEAIDLYTYVYGSEHNNPEIRKYNIKITQEGKIEKLGGNKLSHIFKGIESGDLCISTTSQNLKVFWNEGTSLNGEANKTETTPEGAS